MGGGRVVGAGLVVGAGVGVRGGRWEVGMGVGWRGEWRLEGEGGESRVKVGGEGVGRCGVGWKKKLLEYNSRLSRITVWRRAQHFVTRRFQIIPIH